MPCPNCQRENPPDHTFCGGCGARLVVLCSRCGKECPPANAFCGACGNRLAVEVEEPHEPEKGERRQLTVLFCDLVGSTNLAARLDPEEYREALREYFAKAEDVVAHFGGFVAQHLGDGLLAYFGWPQTYDDSAERALHAGLALVVATATVKAGGAPLAARVGLHTGSVVVSEIGVGRSRETLAVGDTPNVAARVQSAAAPGEVLISGATLRLVAGLFVVEERGEHALKGLPQPIELFAVVQSAGVLGRLGASASRGLTPFVNRVEERALLRSRFERACDGEGQVVVISGEAGIGKSRLAHVLREEIAETPHTWLETAASPHYVNTPFYAVADLLRQRRPWEDDDPQTRAAQLDEALRRAGLDPAEALPLVAPLLEVAVPASYAPLAAVPEVARRRLLATLVAWLFGTAKMQPLVILIEDLHWVDPSTLELLQLLVEQVVTVPVLLIGTARPDFQPPWPSRAHYTQLMLSRLTPRHVREMVLGVAAQNQLLAEVVDAVAARTDGVPLFVEELTKAVTETGVETAAREIPTTLNDSLMARLDRLGPQAKEVAQVAAVCGREFTFSLIRAVHPLPAPDLESALRKLVDAELLHARGMAPEATYSFKHALVLDAAYESLLRSRRRLLHGQVVSALERDFPALLQDSPELLAHHQEAAGDLESAVLSWQLAGERAMERGANREATRHLEHGRQLLDDLPVGAQRDWSEWHLLLNLGKARLATEGFGSTAADEVLTRALDLGERLAEPLYLGMLLLGRFALDLSRHGPQVARRLSERLLPLAERCGSGALLGASHLAAGLVDFHTGALVAASAHFERGLEAYDEKDPMVFPIDPGIGLLTYLADASWRLGRADAARRVMKQALDRAAISPRAADRAWAAQHAAMLHVCLREPDLVSKHAQAALEACSQEVNPTTAVMARILHGWSLAARGRVDAGQVLMRTAIGEMALLGERVGFEMFHALLADTYLAAGELDTASSVLDEGEQACPDQCGDRMLTLIRRARIRVRQQRPESEVCAAFDAALECAQQQGALAHELQAVTDYARWLQAQGRNDEAVARLRPRYAAFQEGHDTHDLREAAELLALLARNSHQFPAASDDCAPSPDVHAPRSSAS